ncbi:hypothetical protein CFBP498_38830 [Xanthomonas hortorum pv. vitians]|uniref:Uncharacterized protein n=1 Tax=Xanthomonas hortorum pv. vitians TaxID=83224 RepID=A0A6V7ES66_9XANT|nr:hypothetical protein CFBP498_38830 [Xanthomonas hortorum pv. vitians]CAD0354048.1 hypothetical protein CFBP498_38830 [Xanthomonas hortorum pv. vitians]
MNYKQCARYLSQLGITLSRNERGLRFRWNTITPIGHTIQFRTLSEARDHWSLASKKAVYQLFFARSLVIAAESLDSTARREFDEWIDGARESRPNALIKQSVTFGASTTTWTFEAKKLASMYGSIASVSSIVLLRQARQERLGALGQTKDSLYEQLYKQCARGQRNKPCESARRPSKPDYHTAHAVSRGAASGGHRSPDNQCREQARRRGDDSCLYRCNGCDHSLVRRCISDRAHPGI